jgi:hypothetical protein
MRSAAKAIIGTAVSIVLLDTARGAEGPQQLDCILTDINAKPGSESRPVIVTFNEANQSLTAKENGHEYGFTNVSITYIAISGQADDVSLGIDRSSLGIIWQHYGPDKVTAEFGHCRAAAAGNDERAKQ